MNSYSKNTKKDKYILITGAAGFIGYHVTEELLKKGYNCVGVDNINNYYDVNLKKNVNFEYNQKLFF